MGEVEAEDPAVNTTQPVIPVSCGAARLQQSWEATPGPTLSLFPADLCRPNYS